MRNITVFECDLNPVFHGLYEWGDRANTKVEMNRDGSATIIQGDDVIRLDCFGFFRDVIKVFDLAIASMPESDVKMKLEYKGLGTSRSLPTCEWEV
jgi:hypothetical protein